MTRINPNVTVSTSLPKGVDVVVVGLASINKGDAAAVGVPAELDKAYQKAFGRPVVALAEAMGAKPAAESITLLPAGATSSEPSLPGIIRQQQLLGNVIRYQVECEAGLLTVDCLNRSAGDLLAVGSTVTLAVARDQLCEVA